MFGVFVRTVLVWHITWAINSVTHLWGYRNYQTDEDSRNNIVVGLISTAKAGTTTIMPIRARRAIVIAGGKLTTPGSRFAS
jgi:hypothetical protein